MYRHADSRPPGIGFHFLFPAIVLLCLALPGSGQAQTAPPDDFFQGLRWQNVGPDRGGRSITAAGSDARPMEYYFGATGGGLWKTEDGGGTWRAVTDGKINTSSVGAVAVCESDPDVVYIGTGETQLRGNIMQGDGVYKSTNGGGTWNHVGLAETQNVSRIRIHPSDCNTVWVGAFGVHSAPNPERGVYKTTDGGESWEQTLYRDDRSGAVDISVHPDNPNILYAALWEAWRKSWGMSSGGPGSGLFRSLDGGESWTEITRNPGLPQEGLVGKIGVAVSPVDPQRIYAIVEHEEGGVFRSEDGGESWTRTNDERKLRQRAFYYTRIYADPLELDRVYVLNTAFYRSDDGGESFDRTIRVPHGDNHDLWIAPSDSERMINANDGGGNVSVNGGRSWTEQDYPTAQFYRVITTAHEPYMICGAQQDNSTACVAPRGWGHLSAYGTPFFSVGGCESGYIAPHPEDPDVYYAGCYGGSLSRYDHRNGQTRAINVWPENPMGQSAEDLVERVQWTFPIVFSHHDPDVLYTGTQKVWRTTNEGQSWEAISEDLTRADPSTMGPSGGPITRDQTGVETYATVFAIAPSHHDPDVIWAGSDDGYVQVTRNGGTTWQNVTPSDAPDFVRINTIEASPNTPGKAYVAGIRYLVENDRSPYVWKTEDFGQSWTRIVHGIPQDDFIRAVREDPVRPGLLYAASERTVYVSFDDGESWQPLSLNLPSVQVADLVVEDHDLVIATHGRSFWVLYGIDPLRQWNPRVPEADAWLFDPADPVRGVDQSVSVTYHLAREAEEVTVEFRNDRGDVLQSFTGTAAEEEEEEEEEESARRGGGTPRASTREGTNRVQWNLRLPGYTDFQDRIFWAAGNYGPTVVPGSYTVALTVDGQEVGSREFQVLMDPRIQGVTVEDLQARFDLALAIRDRTSEANEAVILIRDIKSQIDERLEEGDARDLERAGERLKEALSTVEGEIYQVRNRSNQDPLNFPIKLNNKLAALMGVVESAESRPTDQSHEVFAYLSDLLRDELARLDEILRDEMVSFNAMLEDRGMDPIETDSRG
ncbi:MAG: WD40/YVTN/BNR-like repeat-containing protein [Gemmatimonadota bacterium]